MKNKKKCVIKDCENAGVYKYMGKLFCRKHHIEMNFGDPGKVWESLDPLRLESNKVGFQ